MMPAIAEVACICSLAGVSRSGYYHYLNPEEDRQHRERQDQKDFQRIVEAYQFRGYAKGARGIYMRLIHMDPPMVMNIKKIRRLMKKYGLKCPIRKANPYAVKTGKYIAVRQPGKERSVRLKTLGNDYTEEAIRAHEPPPRRTAPRPAPKRSYKIQHKPRKLTGFRALYFHYLYLLGKLKKPTASPRRRRYMMDEIIKFDRYVEQGWLLMKYRIDTWEQLSMLEEAIQSELDALCGQRKGLYTARRKNPTGTDLSPAILSINQSIKTLRRELKVCGRIEADGHTIRQKLLEPLPTPPKVEAPQKQRPRKWQR